MSALPPCAAIVLAGGEGRRMGGPHKPVTPVGGRPMLLRVLDALRSVDPCIVVGPSRMAPPGVLTTRERPVGAGPVAAVDAGLRALGADAPTLAAIVAADQPFLTESAVHTLRAALAAGPTDADGAVFVDGERRQLLCGVWRVAAVRERMAVLGSPVGVAVRRLFSGLRVVEVPAVGPAPPPWYDCDTADDLERAELWLGAQTAGTADTAGVPAGASPTSAVEHRRERDEGELVTEQGNTLSDWSEQVRRELDLPGPLDRDLILDLTKEVAHNVARPAAPLTAYLLGLAVGAGADPAEAAGRIGDLARRWPSVPVQD